MKERLRLPLQICGGLLIAVAVGMWAILPWVSFETGERFLYGGVIYALVGVVLIAVTEP